MLNRTASIGAPDARFGSNQRQFPLAELRKYVNQHVAWSWDGSQILAAATSLDGLMKKLESMHIEVGNVVFDFVDDPDVSRMGCL